MTSEQCLWLIDAPGARQLGDIERHPSADGTSAWHCRRRRTHKTGFACGGAAQARRSSRHAECICDLRGLAASRGCCRSAAGQMGPQMGGLALSASADGPIARWTAQGGSRLAALSGPSPCGRSSHSTSREAPEVSSIAAGTSRPMARIDCVGAGSGTGPWHAVGHPQADPVLQARSLGPLPIWSSTASRAPVAPGPLSSAADGLVELRMGEVVPADRVGAAVLPRSMAPTAACPT